MKSQYVMIAVGIVCAVLVRAADDCYETGERAQGAVGYPSVPYKNCCDPDAEQLAKDGDWGLFCTIPDDCGDEGEEGEDGEDGGDGGDGGEGDGGSTPQRTLPPDNKIGFLTENAACSGLLTFECVSFLYCDPATFTCQKRVQVGEACDVDSINPCGVDFDRGACAQQPDGSGKCVEPLSVGDVCDDVTKAACTEDLFEGDSVCLEGVCVSTQPGAPLTPCGNEESCPAGQTCAQADDGQQRCLEVLSVGSYCNQPRTIRRNICGDGLRCNGGGVCTFDNTPLALGEECGSGTQVFSDCAPSATAGEEVECSNTLQGQEVNKTCQAMRLELGVSCDGVTRQCRSRNSLERPISCVNGVCTMDDKQTTGMPCGQEGLPACADGLTCETYPEFDVDGVCTNFTKQVGEYCAPYRIVPGQFGHYVGCDPSLSCKETDFSTKFTGGSCFTQVGEGGLCSKEEFSWCEGTDYAYEGGEFSCEDSKCVKA